MKRKYVISEMEIIEFDTEDVIEGSNGDPTETDKEDQDMGEE